MNSDSPCPDQPVLKKVTLGLLTEDELKAVEPHLLGCPECSTQIELAAANDTLIQALGTRAELTPATKDAPVDALIARLHEQVAAAIPLPLDTIPGTAVDTVPPETTEKRIGGYRIAGLLGRGGMGSVLLAEDERLGRKVAIKTMRPELAADLAHRQRFLREARAAAAIEHDHIVPIYQVGEHEGTPFIAMPLLKGESLDEHLKRAAGPLPITEAVRIAREAAEGLAAAHAAGLVHRDIKPSNIWLEGSRKRVKILDFGLAHSTNAADQQLTETGAILGTPAYMAPEQARGEKLDGRADLFSLGCVLYQMLTGRNAFAHPDILRTLNALATHEPAPPASLNPKVPAELNDLTTCLMQKIASARPASAADVVNALQQIERTQQIDSTIVLPRSPSPTLPFTPAPTLSPAPTTTRSSRPPIRRLVAASIAVALLALAGFYSGTIVRFITNQGELIVEIEDPNIEVTIVQNGVVLHDKTAQREFTLNAAPGEIIVSEKDGVQLPTRQFELRRGGVTRVRVTLADLAAARQLRQPPLADPISSPATPAGPPEWKPLFNGQDFVGWKPPQPASAWYVDEGILIADASQLPAETEATYFIHEQSDWRDFHLKLEIRYSPGFVGRIFIRAPISDDDSHTGLGLGVPLYDAEIGNLYQPHRLWPRQEPVATAPDEWVPVEVRAVGPQITVRVKDRVVLETEIPDAPRSGHLALQAAKGGKVEFRNVQIMDLGPARPATVVAADPALSPFDALDPAAIPEIDRYPWQPKELVAIIGSHRWRSEGIVNALAPSPDGKRMEIIVGSWHGVTLEMPSGRTLETFTTGAPNFACYSANGKRYLDARGLWDVAPERKLLASPFRGPYFGMLSADGNRALTLEEQNESGGQARVWEVADGKVRMVAERSNVQHGALSPDGELVILMRAADGVVEVAAVSGGELKKLCEVPVDLGERSTRPRVAFVADGRLATLSDDATLKVWTLAAERNNVKSVAEVKVSDVSRPYILCGSHDGKRLCAATEADFAIVDVTDAGLKLSRERQVMYEVTNRNLTAVAFSSDATELFTGHIGGAVRRWDIAGEKIVERESITIQPLRDFFYHYPLVVSPDGRYVITSSIQNKLGAWRFGGRAPEPLPEKYSAYAPAQFLADGRLLARNIFHTEFGSPGLFRLDGDSLQHELVLASIPNNGYGMAATPDGESFVLEYGDGQIVSYRRVNGRVRKVAATQPMETIYPSLQFASQGRSLVRRTESRENQLSLWDVTKDGIALQTALPVPALIFGWPAVSPDGNLLAAGATYSPEILLWTLRDGKPTRPDRWETGVVENSVAFDPTGRRLVSSGNPFGDGGHITVWDVSTGARLYETKTGRRASHVRFAPDGRHLIVANNDGSIYILRLPLGITP